MECNDGYLVYQIIPDGEYLHTCIKTWILGCEILPCMQLTTLAIGYGSTCNRMRNQPGFSRTIAAKTRAAPALAWEKHSLIATAYRKLNAAT
jgi:hypothetical protein